MRVYRGVYGGRPFGNRRARLRHFRGEGSRFYESVHRGYPRVFVVGKRRAPQARHPHPSVLETFGAHPNFAPKAVYGI